MDGDMNIKQQNDRDMYLLVGILSALEQRSRSLSAL